jgi:hypothetical protein
MKMKLKNKLNLFSLLFFCGLMLVFTSCEDEIDLELDDTEPILVVEGEFSDRDTVQFVKLSYTTNYFNQTTPDFTAEQSATVVLRENGIAIDTFQYNSSTERFELNTAGTAGNDYSIYIKSGVNGKEYISSAEPMFQVPPIDSIFYEFNDDLPFDNSGYEVKLRTLEPQPIGDYYQWKVYINDFYLGSPGDLAYASDESVITDTLIFTAYFMPEEDLEDFLEIYPEVNVRIEQIEITKGFYDFISLIDSQTSAGGLFDAPPAQVKGNIFEMQSDERAIGYFKVHSVTDATLKIEA